MNIKNIFSSTSKILVYIFFITTSYATLVSVSFFDDIIVVGIGIIQLLWLFVNILKIRKAVLVTAALFTLQVANLGVSWVLGDNSDAMDSFWTFTKIIILFMHPIIVEYETEDKEKIFRNFFYLSIPNLLYNCYEVFTTYVQHNYLPGKYAASGMYRVQGFSGHPIFYSLMLTMLLLYLLYFCKLKIRYILAIICFAMCMLTWSSLAQVAALLLVMYKLIQYTKIKNIFKRYVCLLLLCILSGMLIIIFASMLKETYTIRYISVVETIKNINVCNFFVGSGLGEFAENGLSESYVFHILYDSGLCGILLIGVILFQLYKIQFKNKNYAGIFVVSLYLVSMIINEGYMVPMIIFVPVVCGKNILRSIDTKVLLS